MARRTCRYDVHKERPRVTSLVNDFEALFCPLEVRIVRGADIESISNVEDRATSNPTHQ